jgi:hypothetical protein
VEALKQNQSIEMYSAKQGIDTGNTADATDEGTGKHEENMNDTKVADGETEETEDTASQNQTQTVSEQPTASSSGQEMTDFAKTLTDGDRDLFKRIGLTDEQINALSKEEAVEIYRNYRNSNSSSTNNSSSSSSNDNSDSYSEDDGGTEETNNSGSGRPAFEMNIDPSEEVQGYM